MSDYRYAVYFRWKGEHLPDSFNVYTAAERDENIREMKSRGDFEWIAWCRIYASGEYGVHHTVLGKW